MLFNDLSRNRLLSRLSGICFNTPDSSGGDPGSGGDAGGGGGSATPSPAADSGGGQTQEPANHAFNASPSSPEHATRVANILSTKGNDDHLSMTEINDLISFDTPFKPVTPAAPANQQQTPPANQQQTPPANQQTPTPQAPQPLTAEAIAAAVREAIGGGAAPQTPANQTPANEPQPYYGGVVDAVRVSEATLKGLLGTEDPQILAQAAPVVDGLVNGIMNRVMQDAEVRIQAYATAIMKGIPGQVQQLGAVNETERGFYALHPELNKPVFKTTVDTVASVIIQAARKKDPNFKLDERAYRFIGDQVHKKLQADLGFAIPRTQTPVVTNAQPGQRPAASARPAAQQPYVPNGGARPPAASPGANQSADLLSLVV